MPGNITSRNVFGTNHLIKGAGAKLVQTWQDIVSEFPPETAARILPPELRREGKGRGGPAPTSPAHLSENERAVFKLITVDEPAHIDALAEKAALPVHDLSGVLLGPEMRELIRQLPGKCFVRRL